MTAPSATAPIPVILSGGSGTRLWPLSRAMLPKQFLSFHDPAGRSLFGATIRRIATANGFAQPIILCNNDHRFLIKDELEALRMAAEAIILEPVARNTAPAITVAAIKASQRNPDAILLVMPSDHVITREAAFLDAVARAAEVAASGRLVLFGIEPASPHTGYGYIRRGAPLGSSGAFTVAAFFEKPDREKAEAYLAAGGYAWNSGIFVLHARTYLAEIERFEPKVFAAAREALERATPDLGFLRLDKAAFAQSPTISIDYAVMERTDKSAMLPIDIGWSDLGAWSSLWEVTPRDDQGNAVTGDVMLEDTTGTYVHAGPRLVATIGIKDLVIVDTPDALLVADKARTQDVGHIVQRLKANGRTEHEQHVRNLRPWGFFETLSVGPRFQVKRLHVRPGGKLSMQRHHHRSEHWVVVHGTAKVTVDGKERLIPENESVFIVATQWHRLENPGRVPLEIIEVQIGSYLGEDDIERADDVYNRAPDETK